MNFNVSAISKPYFCDDELLTETTSSPPKCDTMKENYLLLSELAQENVDVWVFWTRLIGTDWEVFGFNSVMC